MDNLFSNYKQEVWVQQVSFATADNFNEFIKENVESDTIRNIIIISSIRLSGYDEPVFTFKYEEKITIEPKIS